MLGDLFRSVGSLTGSVIGLPLAVVAVPLGITADMVKEAIKAGCESYEDIKDFYDL